MMSSRMEEYLGERRRLVDAALEDRLASADAEPAKVHEAMRYAVLGGGKRLRPIFAMAVAELGGYASTSVLDAACGIEFAHTASLILDDLPCMDDADRRRGKPCLHLAFEEATAILASVALLSKAFRHTAKCAEAAGCHGEAAKVTALLSEAIGTSGLVHGQHLDLAYTGGAPSPEELVRVHHYKAGALFVASVRIPAVLTGMSAADTGALERFAADLGLAFQMTDDLLDAKRPGEDAEKATFITHYGEAGARDKAHALLDEAVGALDGFGEAAETLRQLAGYVRTRKE